MNSRDKRYYRYPIGFKKKLAEHYNLNGIRCVLCWSTISVATDHYRDLDNRTDNDPYLYQLDAFIDTGKVKWSDLSKFVLLCASCHGKVERMRECWWGKTRATRPPMLNLLDDIVKEKNNP